MLDSRFLESAPFSAANKSTGKRTNKNTMKYASLLILFISVFSAFLLVALSCDARPTGPAFAVERLKQAESQFPVEDMVQNEFPFPHLDVRFAILLPDEAVGTLPTTSTSTTTTTSSSSTTTSSSSATSGITSSTTSNETTSSLASTTTTTTTSAPPAPFSPPLTFNLSSLNNRFDETLSEAAMENYQVVILTSKRLFSFRYREFSAKNPLSPADRFSGAQEVWSVGDRSVTAPGSYVDGTADPDMSSLGIATPSADLNQARFSDPVSFAPISGRSRQRFPFPVLRGFLVVERSACAVRFVNFHSPASSSSSSFSPSDVRRGSLRAKPTFVTTIVGPNCGTQRTRGTGRSAQLTSPSFITSMTSGGLFFIADGTCVRVLYGFSDKGSGIRSVDSSVFFNGSAALARIAAHVDTIAGDCASNGVSSGPALAIARFFQIVGLAFDAEKESVLFIVQRFGYLRKLVPMPKREIDIAIVKRTAIVATISSQLAPGEISHVLLWRSGLDESESIFIVSPTGCVVSNATTDAEIDVEPRFLPLHLFADSGVFAPSQAAARSIIALPNGSLLTFSTLDPERAAPESSSPPYNSRVFLFTPAVFSDLRQQANNNSLRVLQRQLYLVPDRGDTSSASASSSLEPSPSPSLSHTRTQSVSYPTQKRTASRTFRDSISLSDSRGGAGQDTFSISKSAPSPSLTDFSASRSSTFFELTSSVSSTVFFFRPRSVIPPSVMYTFINRVTLSAGFWGTITGANPAAAMMGSRIVSIIDSCACPSLQVVKTDSTLRYFSGMAYGLSDAFEWQIDTIDNQFGALPVAATTKSSALLSSSLSSAKTKGTAIASGGSLTRAPTTADPGDELLKEQEAAQEALRQAEIGLVLKEERILPRLRAVIVMHVGAAMVLGPPLLVGLRIVDGFRSGEGMPAALRLGLISVVVSLWLQGGLTAAVCLMRLTPSKSLELLIVVGPHLLFCFLFVGVLPVRMTFNSLRVKPRPHLEIVSYADEDEQRLEDAQARVQEKQNRKRDEEEKKRRKKEEDERLQLSPNEAVADAEMKRTAAAAAAEAAAAAAQQHNDNNNDAMNSSDPASAPMIEIDRSAPIVFSDDSRRQGEQQQQQDNGASSARAATPSSKTQTEEELLKKLRLSRWVRFSRWAYGDKAWMPPFSESFPRSWPLLHPFLATSPTSFFGWLYLAHVAVTVGISIVDGHRFAKSLSSVAFTVECTWYYEIASASIYVTAALVVIVLQILYTRRDGGGPFLSPLSSIGHFIAVVFAALAKCLQVACSFAESVAVFQSERDDIHGFRGRLVSVADLCVLIATLGLFLAALPALVLAINVIKSGSCGVDTSAADTQAHRQAAAAEAAATASSSLGGDDATRAGFSNSSSKRANLRDMEAALHRKGELWRMLDKQEKRRVMKPAHLDMLRRPLTSSQLENGELDDKELAELNEILGGSIRKRQKALALGLDADDTAPDILLDGASIVANDQQWDNMERSALLVRHERIQQYKRQLEEERQRLREQIENEKRKKKRAAENADDDYEVDDFSAVYAGAARLTRNSTSRTDFMEAL